MLSACVAMPGLRLRLDDQSDGLSPADFQIDPGHVYRSEKITQCLLPFFEAIAALSKDPPDLTVGEPMPQLQKYTGEGWVTANTCQYRKIAIEGYEVAGARLNNFNQNRSSKITMDMLRNLATDAKVDEYLKDLCADLRVDLKVGDPCPVFRKQIGEETWQTNQRKS